MSIELNANTVIKLVCGVIFEDFKLNYGIGIHFDLNPITTVNAIRNAKTDITRVGSYQSGTGADAFRHAVCIAKWIADLKPIQVNIKHPQSLTNNDCLNSARINASFATFFLYYSLENKIEFSNELMRDLRYCFEFRNATMPAEAIALLLKHQPRKT